MPADDPNALLLYRLAEQEKALKEAQAEIKEFKKDQKTESKLLRDELAKDISDKFAHHDKRITEIIRNVSLYGAFVPIFLVLIGAVGAWFTIKNLHSEITYETQAWLNGDGTATVTRLAEKVTNDYLSSEAGKKRLKSAIFEKLTPLAENAIKEFNTTIGRQLSLSTSIGASPVTALSAETQKALDAVKNQPDEQRSPDAWRALIYSYLGTKSYETALSAADRWLASPNQTPEQTAEALVLKGNTLYASERYADARSTFDEVIGRFSMDTLPALREQVAKALIYKGGALVNLSPPQFEAAITASDEVDRRFSADPALRELVAMALLNKGSIYLRFTPPQREAGIAAYDELIRRFSTDPTPALRKMVATALYNKGDTLSNLTPPQHEATLAANDEVIRRFSVDTSPALREVVAMALVSKGVTLGKLIPPQRKAEIAAYGELERRFGSDPAPFLRRLVANALYYRGRALEAENEHQHARMTYEDYLGRFGDAPEPSIQEITMNVRNSLAALK